VFTPSHREGVGVEIYVLPPEAQQFPSPESGMQGHGDQGLEAVGQGGEQTNFFFLQEVAGPSIVLGEGLDGLDRVLGGLPVSDGPVKEALEGGDLPISGRGGHLLKPLRLIAFHEGGGDLGQGLPAEEAVESPKDRLVALMGAFVGSTIGQKVSRGLLKRQGSGP